MSEDRGPRAHHFQTFECGDPKCGIHILATNEDDEPICEIVMSQSQMREVIAHFQVTLYRKAAMS